MEHELPLIEKELPLIDWKERILFFLGWRELFLIEGDSMLPALKDGDYVLINPSAEYRPGDIVLAQHPFKKSIKIIKRVREITADGKYFLVGDNAPDSTDSRSFGALSAKDVLGRAEAKMK